MTKKEICIDLIIDTKDRTVTKLILQMPPAAETEVISPEWDDAVDLEAVLEWLNEEIRERAL